MALPTLSIRHKIIVAITTLYLFMTAGFVGSYYFMSQLEGKIGYLEDISKLEESILEIRRLEKNYFLYGDDHALRTILYQLPRAKSLLDKNVDKLMSLSSVDKVTIFTKELDNYQRRVSKCADWKAREKIASTYEERVKNEAAIRKVGSSISEFAKDIAQKKRESISRTIGTTVRLQLLASAFVGLGLIVVAGFVFVKVMKPLRLLEHGTETIAKGQFKPIEKLPEEKELRDIFDSFNRMAEQLKVREDQLVQSKKLASLGTMLAGVAHEVNNPLSNISTSCEILLEEIEETDRERLQTVLKKVLEQVEKARGIVLNLLEFSRHREFYRESFNLKDVLEKSIRLLHGQIPAGAGIVTKIDENVTLVGDKQRLQQAFINLIGNALHAIDNYGEVEIRAENVKNGMVTIEIKDTGHGIQEEDLPKIFDPFFTTKDVGQGTGLGLFITHDIIVRHGGSIRVGSVLGAGTTFTITLSASEPKE